MDSRSGMVKSGWTPDQAGRDPDGSGMARSRWIKQKEVFVSSSNLTGGVLESSRSSEYEEKLKMAKIESKKAKLIRKPKRAKI